MNKKTNFDLENDELLQFMIVNKFFSNFKKGKNHKNAIELYVTSECNQKCEYCYLIKHGDKLYPKEIRKENIILKNLEMLLDYFSRNKFYLDEIDIFSGEILGTKLGYDILDVIYKYISEQKIEINHIMIPTNCSFILNKDEINKVQTYIDKYRNSGCKLLLSCSVDGLILEQDTREFKDSSKNNLRTLDFYNNLFDFALKNNFGFHPMVSAYGIEKWIDNLNWWIEISKNHNKTWHSNIMFLEVRNNEWTKEKIISYLKFLNYFTDKVIEDVGIDNFITEILFNSSKIYNGYRIERMSINDCNVPSCSIPRFLCVRLGDLKICPCHRLSYDHLNYGEFEVNNDQITGISANNIQFANKVLFGSTRNSLKCDVCVFNKACIRGCLGCQFENNQDPLLPCDTVCDLLKAKYCFQVYKYYNLKIEDKIQGFNGRKKVGEDLIKSMKIIKETKEYMEWNKIFNIILKKN